MARCSTCHRRLAAGQPCPVHGGSPAHRPATGRPDTPPVASLLGESLGTQLGAGGFAAVWSLGEARVAKIAHVSHDLARARIAREAEALAGVGAPAVPAFHGTGVLDDGRGWLVMERITGQTIGDVITGGPQRLADAVAIGLGTLDALAKIHATNFVHRDLKPDNLVRTTDGRIVILDLGLARKLPDDPDDPTAANVQVGSLEYMPPEQIADSAAVDERSDLYAFGCVLYELIAGRPPFVGDAAALERAHTALRPPRLSALMPAGAALPAAIEALVHDCLAKEPARRPPSAAVARARLASAFHEPAQRSGSNPISMIRESKQPVVLLWVELPRVDRALLGMFAARRLVVASQRGRRVLAGAIGGEHGDPATTAIAAARELAAAGARVALHLDALRVGSSANGQTLEGDAVDKPESWLPAGAWSNVIVTRALAAVIQDPTHASEVGPEFVALGAERADSALYGRDALVTDLAADAAVALIGSRSAPARGPAFTLLVGEAGVGKTAFANELARRIAELGVAVHVGTVPTPGTGKPAHSALAGLIGAAPAGPIVRTVGDALRKAARARPTAVILDDLHLADHELYDALEYATLGGEPLPLWVLGVAAPRIEMKRPQLGARAERHRRDVLPPLDEDAAVALAAALLRPAEYPALRSLRKLAAIARGNPLHLATLAREIHERGAIRARAGGAHFLDTTALDELSPAALGPWLAARELAGLAAELVALARICAVLAGDASDVRRDEVVAIVEAVELAGGATTTIDVEVGLDELVAAGVLVASEHGFQFRQPLVEEGVYATTDELERLALHRAALDHWLATGDRSVAIAERIARHAEAVGARDAAAAAFATLGEHALRDQRMLDADQAWSGALRNLDPGIAAARARVGRAKARYRLQRMADAVVDLDDAIEIAARAGDLALELEAMIEKGVVLDFREDFAGSKAVSERARERLATSGAPDNGIAIDLDLADGRALFREQRMAEAAPSLRDVLRAATDAGRHETQTIAALLLGCVLAELRELDEAERVFSDMIERCWKRDDRFHLAAAYGNRAWLWSARGAVDRTEEDLRLVIQLARESGQAHFERIGAYNLGEDRLWQGALDEALQLARRGLSLQTHAAEGGGTRPDRLLLARVLAARGDLAELREVLDTFSGEDLEPDEAAMIALLGVVARGGDASTVEAAFAGLEDSPSPVLLELCHLAARHGGLTDDRRAHARTLAVADPIWARRISEF